MFRSMTIIKELVLHLAKVIFTRILKHSVKLRRYTANPRITRLIRSEKSSRNTKTRKVNN